MLLTVPAGETEAT